MFRAVGQRPVPAVLVAAVGISFSGILFRLSHVSSSTGAFYRCVWALPPLFVLARNATTFSNSASFPFYVLGGILVPVSVLPHWIQPLSSAVFLSWSADLLRAALRPTPMHDFAFRLGMVAFLGACGLTVGVWSMRVILVRVRASGELGTT
jgi:ABC-2 type transport system permease protein